MYCDANQTEQSGTGMRPYAITREWSDQTADWTHASSGVSWTAGGALGMPYTSTRIPIGTGQFKDFEMTGAVQDFVEEPANNFGVMICMVDKSSVGFRFCSSNHADAAKRPKLTVTYEENQTATRRPAVPERLATRNAAAVAATIVDMRGRRLAAAAARTGVCVVGLQGTQLQLRTTP